MDPKRIYDNEPSGLPTWAAYGSAWPTNPAHGAWETLGRRPVGWPAHGATWCTMTGVSPGAHVPILVLSQVLADRIALFQQLSWQIALICLQTQFIVWTLILMNYLATRLATGRSPEPSLRRWCGPRRGAVAPRRHRIIPVTALFLVSPAVLATPLIAGYLEHATLGDGAISFTAKLDTGAKSSSLNSANSEVFSRNGEKWIRVRLTNRLSQSFVLQAPIKKTVLIRRASTSKMRRYVIDLMVCVGGYRATTEFTLANRSALSHQVLIGRRFLADQILVNSSASFLLNNRC